VDFVEICNFYVGSMVIKAAKRIYYFDTICRSYRDLNFGVTFWNTVRIGCQVAYGLSIGPDIGDTE